MVKYNHTIEETVKAIQVYDSLWNLLYNLQEENPESININADDEVQFSVDYVSYSFPINLLTVYDPVYAIRNHIRNEIARKEAEKKQRQEQLAQEAKLKSEQKEYETYLKLKEKYEKLS